MLCQRCGKREATFHMKRIVGGKEEEIHLCEQCAKELGYLSESGLGKFTLSFPDFFENFWEPLFSPMVEEVKKPVIELSCPHCGMTFSDFKRKGRFGCPNCYRTFRDRIRPILREIHGATGHAGKTPEKAGAKPAHLEEELERLKADLKKAVEAEEYERAAVIRDKIKELEAKIKRGGKS